MWMGFRYKLLNLNCILSNVLFRVLTVLFSVCIKYCSIRSLKLVLAYYFLLTFAQIKKKVLL